MTSAALALVLLAGLCHAGWNLVAKKIGGGNHFVLLGSMMVCLVWGPFILYEGVAAVAQWRWPEWAAIVVSSLVNVVYFRALLHGYAVSDMSVVYPVARGTGPLIASAGAVLWLGESLSWRAAAGALAIVAGVFVLAGGPGMWRRARAPEQRALVSRGIVWGAVTGLTVAAYTVVDAYAVKVLQMSPLLVIYFSNVVRVPLMLPAALRDAEGFASFVRVRWRGALLFAVLAPLAYVLVLYAMRLAPVSHVAPAREVSMLFAALLGGALLAEGDRGLRLLGAACIAAGVVALALG